MDTSYLPVLLRNCPKCVVVFFFRGGLPQNIGSNMKQVLFDNVMNSYF